MLDSGSAEVTNNSIANDFDWKKKGYLCPCVGFGSPRPGVVSSVIFLHNRDCPVRERVEKESQTISFYTMVSNRYAKGRKEV